MNAEEFYEKFKACLKQMDTAWGDKAEVDVHIRGTFFVLEKPGYLIYFDTDTPTQKEAKNGTQEN